ncbi:YSC84-related protein [Ideonella azotifigens]|uniref:YSC84-related protein n=1 Tax=Ideonella azotifigens TaxID=513160 RepID=UPI003CD06BE2
MQSEKALNSAYKTSAKLGVDATVALGTKGGRLAAAGIDLVLYSKIKGVFAGVAVDGLLLKGFTSGYLTLPRATRNSSSLAS